MDTARCVVEKIFLTGSVRLSWKYLEREREREREGGRNNTKAKHADTQTERERENACEKVVEVTEKCVLRVRVDENASGYEQNSFREREREREK